MAVETKPASKLLVKQVIGRLLLDTSHYACPFSISGQEGEWTITIEGVPTGIIEGILRYGNDLNLFYFEEKPERTPTLQKYWLYAKEPPFLIADTTAERIVIKVDSKTPYSNEIV
jgi:hypothetical protein